MVEAIFEEISENEHAEDGLDKATLKTYIHDIYKLLRTESFQRKNKEEEANLYTSWSLGLLAFIALIFITNSSQESPDFEWLQQNKFPIKLWGIALASIYVGASIEKTGGCKIDCVNGHSGGRKMRPQPRRKIWPFPKNCLTN